MSWNGQSYAITRVNTRIPHRYAVIILNPAEASNLMRALKEFGVEA